MIKKHNIFKQTLNSYIVAEILAATLGVVNCMINGVVSGHLIGSSAFSAIIMTLPFVGIQSIVYILFTVKASHMVENAIGEQGVGKASDIYSASVTATAITGIIVSILTWNLKEPIAGLICKDTATYPFVLDYLRITLPLSFIPMIAQTLIQFLNVSGKAIIAVRTIVYVFIINVLFSIILTKVGNGNLSFTATAPVLSSLIGCILALTNIRKGFLQYKFIIKDYVKSMCKISTSNLFMVFFVTMLFFRIIVIENKSTNAFGQTGIVMVTILVLFFTMLTICTLVQSRFFEAKGLILIKQNDYKKVRDIYHHHLIVTVSVAAITFIIAQIFPKIFPLLLFSIDDETIDVIAKGFQIASISFIPFVVILFMARVYKTFKHKAIITTSFIIFILMLMLHFIMFSNNNDQYKVWFSYPIASWFSLTILVLVSYFARIKKHKNVQFLSLIPNPLPYRNDFNTTIHCSEKEKEFALNEIKQHVKDIKIDDRIAMNITICADELLDNVVSYAKDKDITINICIFKQEDSIELIISDVAPIFNPASLDESQLGLGLTLVHSLCNDFKYIYVCNSNVSLLSWYTDDSRNKYNNQMPSEAKIDELLDNFDSNKNECEALLSLRGIHKTYPGIPPLHVLKGVDLDIHEGELVSIMGASGSGKSTLLNVIGILDDYDEGEYHLGGHLIKDLNEDEQARYRNKLIGFIFQTFNLINFKNARDNVALPLMYRGVDRETRNKLAMEYLEKVGLKEHWNHTPMQMSGGQRQRVAIARALIQHPKIILADEPTGALDSKTTQEVMDMLIDVNRNEGLTVIIVTHEKDIADQTDRRIFFKDGVIFKDERK